MAGFNLSPVLVSVVVLFVSGCLLFVGWYSRHAVVEPWFSSSSLEHSVQEKVLSLEQQLTTLQQQLKSCRDNKLRIRRDYGRFFCQSNNYDLGPYGGFCASPRLPTLHYLDVSLANGLLDLFQQAQARTVIDFGAGLGQYDTGWRAKGLVVHAYDGAEGIEEFTNGSVTWLDLSEPVFDEVPHADWVVSLEVGEHIEAQYEQTFIDNVCSHALKGVILSWAVPGQGGHHHVNMRTNEYVAQQLRLRGFEYVPADTDRLRSMVTTSTWFQTTLMVFRKP